MQLNYLVIANSPSFFQFLLNLDRTIAQLAGERVCNLCGEKLHRSDWLRKGFGIPHGCSPEVLTRYSFQCKVCRTRHTPNSLIWMYYRRYSSCLQLLASALQGRGKRQELESLCKTFKISRQLLGRWRRWWKEVFVKTPFWKIHLIGLGFMKHDDLIHALLEHFDKKFKCLRLSLERLMVFLSRYRTLGLWTIHPLICEHLWFKAPMHFDLGAKIL
jgi:hypothetical protein